MTTYYAINSDLGYIRGLTVSGELEIGGSDIIKNMSDDERYMREIYDLIINHTTHEVSLEKICLEIIEVM